MCVCVWGWGGVGGVFPSCKKNCCISSGKHLSFHNTEITARLQDFVFFVVNLDTLPVNVIQQVTKHSFTDM